MLLLPNVTLSWSYERKTLSGNQFCSIYPSYVYWSIHPLKLCPGALPLFHEIFFKVVTVLLIELDEPNGYIRPFA